MGCPFQLLFTLTCDLHEYVRRGDEGDLNSFSRKELLNLSAMGGGGVKSTPPYMDMDIANYNIFFLKNLYL